MSRFSLDDQGRFDHFRGSLEPRWIVGQNLDRGFAG